jgi:hypothetical protein
MFTHHITEELGLTDSKDKEIEPSKIFAHQHYRNNEDDLDLLAGVLHSCFNDVVDGIEELLNGLIKVALLADRDITGKKTPQNDPMFYT